MKSALGTEITKAAEARARIDLYATYEQQILTTATGIYAQAVVAARKDPDADTLDVFARDSLFAAEILWKTVKESREDIIMAQAALSAPISPVEEAS